MAFTAKIQAITLVGATINVDVLYADSASGWSLDEPFSLPATGNVVQQGSDYIHQRGSALKATLANSQSTQLQALVGAIITIN